MGKRRLPRSHARPSAPAKSHWKFWTAAGAVALIVAIGIGYYAFWYEPERARVGQPAPDFTLRLFNGERVALSSLRGTPVLVNFWHST
jgi:cytochrome c biogenesis protein CcmG/thiol:disulfide interchange protein DsbE